MIVYVENPKESMDNLLELICEFSNVIEYKANMWKLVIFLYTSKNKK